MQRLLEPVAQKLLNIAKQDKILYDQWLNHQITKDLVKVLQGNRESLLKRLEEANDIEMHDLSLRSAINTGLLETLFEIKPIIEVKHKILTLEH